MKPKAYLNDLIDKAQISLRAGDPTTTRIEPVTGPLADLCRDIRENAEDYEWDGIFARHREDRIIFLGNTQPAVSF